MTEWWRFLRTQKLMAAATWAALVVFYHYRIFGEDQALDQIRPYVSIAAAGLTVGTLVFIWELLWSPFRIHHESQATIVALTSEFEKHTPKIALDARLLSTVAYDGTGTDYPRYYLVGTVTGLGKLHATGAKARLVGLAYCGVGESEFKPVAQFTSTLSLPWALVPGDRFGSIEIGEAETKDFNIVIVDRTSHRMLWYEEGPTRIPMTFQLAQSLNRVGDYKFSVQVITEQAIPVRKDIYLEWRESPESVGLRTE